MRVVETHQTELGNLPIADIKFNIKSWDDIPPLLRGLQYIYLNDEINNPVASFLVTSNSLREEGYAKYL